MAGPVGEGNPLFDRWVESYDAAVVNPVAGEGAAAAAAPQPDVYRRYDIANNCFKANTVPMSIRKMVQAQHSCESRTDEHPLGDTRSIRVKLFMTASFGVAFSAVARIIRLAVWTVFLPLTALYHVGKASRYNLEGHVVNHMKEYLEEWVDLFATVVSCPLALIKMFKPDAFSGATHSLRNYYMTRIDRRNTYDQGVQGAIQAYDAEVARGVGRVQAARA